jgi:hypothetical protein
LDDAQQSAAGAIPEPVLLRDARPRIFMVQIARNKLAGILRSAPGIEHRESMRELAGFFVEDLRVITPLPEAGHCGGVQRHGGLNQTSRLGTGSFLETEIGSGVMLEFPRVA